MYYILIPWLIIGLIYSTVLFAEHGLPRIKNKLDILTKGKHNELADTYVCILAHVIDQPEEWRIDKNNLRFPREGNSTRIHISREKNKIQIRQDSVQDGNYVDVTGYFEQKFTEIMDRGYKKQSMISMMSSLYPDQILMIEDSSKDSIQNPMNDINNIELFSNKVAGSKSTVERASR